MEQRDTTCHGPAAVGRRVNHLYLHIPFCRSKCPYCSFVSTADSSATYRRYLEALLVELTQNCRAYGDDPLATLFVGGGTPTVLGGELLGTLIERCRACFGFADGIELTVEANPGTMSPKMCQTLAAHGVNRLSIGVQSLVATELAVLGRGYEPIQVYELISWARDAGIEQLGFDLMYGIPGQSRASWAYTLERVAELRPDHLSLYQLTVEKGTPYFERAARGRLELPAEESIQEMDRLTERWRVDLGYQRYEIANYCLPGHQCRHNLVYWRNLPYLGGGAAAVSYLGGCRSRRLSDPLAYCRALERGWSVVESSERLEPLARYRETVVLGLRLLEGVSDDDLERRFGYRLEQVYGPLLDELDGAGLIEWDGNRLRLSQLGLRLANRVMAALV